MTPSDPRTTPIAIVDGDSPMPDEQAVEAALRPRTLDEFVGQERVREQLGLVLEAARRAAGRPTTCCSSGRPGWARRRWR